MPIRIVDNRSKGREWLPVSTVSEKCHEIFTWILHPTKACFIIEAQVDIFSIKIHKNIVRCALETKDQLRSVLKDVKNKNDITEKVDEDEETIECKTAKAETK